MKPETVEDMLEYARKFADAADDKAVKSDEDNDYWYHKGVANLLRVMGEKIKHLEEWAYKA
jgi:hypothetical protein